MNEAFEKWKMESLRLNPQLHRSSQYYEGAEDGWEAALAHGREPQTAETCQHVPPHRRFFLEKGGANPPIDEDAPGPDDFIPNMEYEICLVCEAEKQARQEALKPPPIVSRWNV